MSLFDNARDWLGGKLQEAAGVSVTYTRSSTTVAVTAWVGRTVFASVAEGGARVEFGDRDYLILASDLTSLGIPRIGDRITETIDSVSTVFEVQTPETGEPHWRWSGPDRAVYRIHVRRVS